MIGVLLIQYKDKVEILNSQVVLLTENIEVQVEELEKQNNLLSDLELENNNLITVVNGLEKENDILRELKVVPKAQEKRNEYKSQDTETKTVYLTFDDGPSKNTEDILDILKEEGIVATFFVIGRADEYSKSLYKRIVEEGHAIGNHTYSHNYTAIYKSVDAFVEDFTKLENLLLEASGVKPKIIRYPGGSNTLVGSDRTIHNAIIDEITKQGYVHFDWNVDSNDASKVTQDKDVIVNSVINSLRKTSIILFHDSKPKTTTVEALPEIIKTLKDKGYSFEVLNSDGYKVQFIK